jgi:hypothetical protein
MRWISFAQADSMSRSVIHLLPATRGGMAAQPVSCVIELFGDRPDSTEVAIDGMRLNQPDGIRLEEAFPRLREGGNSLVGIAVNLDSAQQKGDLSSSICELEVISRNKSVRFKMALRKDNSVERSTIPIISDTFTQTSLILTNQGSQYIEVQLAPQANLDNLNSQPLTNISIAPFSVSEYNLGSMFLLGSAPFNCQWGETRLATTFLIGQLPPEVAAFIVYRENSSKRIQSVLEV